MNKENEKKEGCSSQAAGSPTDSEMLSWLDRKGWFLSYDEGDPEVGAFPVWTVDRPTRERGVIESVSYGNTVREALRNAMQENDKMSGRAQQNINNTETK